MKKKSVILIIGGIVLLLLVYKIVLLVIYKTDKEMNGYKKFIELYENKRTLTVKENRTATDVITMKKINFANAIGKYQITSNKLVDTYKTYTGERGVINVTFLGNICDTTLLDDKLNSYIEKYCKRENISDDLDFFDYMYKNRDKRVGIFSSKNDILENYIFRSTINNMISNLYEGLTILEGSLKGYILETDSMMDIHILKGKNMYLLAIEKKNYSDDFLNSIYFSDKEKYNCDFIRTYRVLDIQKSSDDDYLDVKVGISQEGEVQTIKVSKILGKDMKIGKNYEFKYRQVDRIARDSILDIYNSSELLFIKETEREGLNQLQEKYCN